jgi:hypothetical protein
MTDYGTSALPTRRKTLVLPFLQKSYKTARWRGGIVEDAFFRRSYDSFH